MHSRQLLPDKRVLSHAHYSCRHRFGKRSNKPKPFPEKIQAKEGDVNSVKYAAKRIDPEVTFTDEACAKLTKIPRIFLKAALTQMVQIAKEEGISVIDGQALEIINDKRRKEKK